MFNCEITSKRGNTRIISKCPSCHRKSVICDKCNGKGHWGKLCTRDSNNSSVSDFSGAGNSQRTMSKRQAAINVNVEKEMVMPSLEWNWTEFIKMLPESLPTARVNISINEEAMTKFGSKLTMAEARKLRPTHQMKSWQTQEPKLTQPDLNCSTN